MKSFSSILGWLLLLAVLAVPSFLFYNWWTKSRQQVSAELAQEPVAHNVFQQNDKPVVSTQTVQVVRSTAAVLAAAPKAPAASAQAPQPPSSSAVAVSTQTRSYYNPTNDRNPMFSPEDYRRLSELEEQRKAAELHNLTEASRPKASGIESRIRLQGIVGNAAIINGEMYYVGQAVLGAKLTKLGSDYVVMDFKGRKFRKTLR